MVFDGRFKGKTLWLHKTRIFCHQIRAYGGSPAAAEAAPRGVPSTLLSREAGWRKEQGTKDLLEDFVQILTPLTPAAAGPKCPKCRKCPKSGPFVKKLKQN